MTIFYRRAGDFAITVRVIFPAADSSAGLVPPKRLQKNKPLSVKNLHSPLFFFRMKVFEEGTRLQRSRRGKTFFKKFFPAKLYF
jgi:hypothetical protein